MKNIVRLWLCMLGWAGGLAAGNASGSEGSPATNGEPDRSRFVTVATVKERDALAAPTDGLTVLMKATGNFHRWQAADKTWSVLNESSVLNVRDFGVTGSGADDTAALVRVFQYASTRGLKNYWAPVTIYFPSGVYRIASTISEPYALVGTSLKGNGATIIGPGKDKPLFDLTAVPSLSTRISDLTFDNFKNVIKCWGTNGNCSWVGNVTFQNCRFSNGDYVMVNNLTPNMYPVFNNVIVENCNLYKGMSDSVCIDNVAGMTKTDDWSGGWCEGGGEEDGIKCGTSARFRVNNVMCSPCGVNGSPTADQSWFKLSGEGMVSLTACRFGGESGGIPLVKNEGTRTVGVFVSAVEHWTAWRPRYIFETFPQAFSETGVTGGAGGGILGGGAAGLKNGLKINPLRVSAQAGAQMRLLDELARPKDTATIGFLNYNPMPYDPVSKTTSQDDHAVFHGHGCTLNVTYTNAEAGFEGLKGKRYSIADVAKFKKNEQTQLCAQLNFEAASDRLYNLTFFYRSRSVKGIDIDCLMPGIPPAEPSAWQEVSKCASLADTYGVLAQATVSFYVEKAGLHALYLNAFFGDPLGFVEIYPISITDGPFAAPYISGPRQADGARDKAPTPNDHRYYSQHQTTLHFMGDAAPKDGRWRKGSLIYNNNPAPGVPVGWVCTKGGEPGVWCPFGVIGNPQ